MAMKARYALLWTGSLLAAFGAGLVAPRIKAAIRPPAPPNFFFADVEAREEAPCPAAGPRTMVAVIIGQSLGGNWSGERSVGREGVLNLYNGRCYRARDPLLGATGIAGNHWTQVANQLVDDGRFDKVILLQATRGRTAITNFVPPNEGYVALQQELAARPGLAVSHVFIQQGQTDLMNGATYDAYRASYATVLQEMRKLFPSAAMFVSIEGGYCQDERHNHPPSPDNPIHKAQYSLIDPAQRIYQGPEVDRILDASKRYDGCHPSGEGARLLADAWTKAILDHDAR